MLKYASQDSTILGKTSECVIPVAATLGSSNYQFKVWLAVHPLFVWAHHII